MDNTQPSSAKGNLLIVDDDLSARQTMEGLLAPEGYEGRCAPNGQTALTFSQEDPPELILLDIRLPDMDGYEVCRRLKEDHRTQDIPVIFIIGLEDGADKITGFEAGGGRLYHQTVSDRRGTGKGENTFGPQTLVGAD